MPETKEPVHLEGEPLSEGGLREALRRMVEAAERIEAATNEPCTCGMGDGYEPCEYCDSFGMLRRDAEFARRALAATTAPAWYAEVRAVLCDVGREHELARAKAEYAARRLARLGGFEAGHDGQFGIAIKSDPDALEWQRYDRELRRLRERRQLVTARVVSATTEAPHA